MRRVFSGWVAASLLTASPLAAQHPTPSAQGEVQPPSSCDYCHAAHVGRPTRFTLRDATVEGQIEAWQEARAPGTTAVTASCLRCHLSPSVRQRRLGDDAGPIRSLEARYLASDPAALHPLGIVEVRDVPQGVSLRRPFVAVRPLAAASGGATVLECTDCHDPHDRQSPEPDPGEQRLICGGCHAAASGSTIHLTLACADCHSLHQARSEAGLLQAATADLQCRTCHSEMALPTAAATGFGGRPRLGAAVVDARHGAEANCSSCHAAHGGTQAPPIRR